MAIVCKHKDFFFFGALNIWLSFFSLLLPCINPKGDIVRTDSGTYDMCVIPLIELLQKTEIAVSVGTGLE